MHCVVRTLLVVCTSWLLAGAWALPRWSRVRRTGRRDELVRRLLRGVVVPTAQPAQARRVTATVVGQADRLRPGDVVGEVVG